LFCSDAQPARGLSLRFTGSLAITLGFYQVSVCELAQFLEKNLGNISRFRVSFAIM